MSKTLNSEAVKHTLIQLCTQLWFVPIMLSKLKIDMSV